MAGDVCHKWRMQRVIRFWKDGHESSHAFGVPFRYCRKYECYPSDAWHFNWFFLRFHAQKLEFLSGPNAWLSMSNERNPGCFWGISKMKSTTQLCGEYFISFINHENKRKKKLVLWESIFSYTLGGADIFFSFWFTFYYHMDFHPSECFSFGSSFSFLSGFHFFFSFGSKSLRMVFIWVFFLSTLVFFISKWCSCVCHAWCSLFLSKFQTSECAIFRISWRRLDANK